MFEPIKKMLSFIPKILQAILFIVMFLLALRNTQPVMLDVYFSRFQMPLIILMVVLLIIGMLMGFLLTIPRVYRLKQKLKHISKDLDVKIAEQQKQVAQQERDQAWIKQRQEQEVKEAQERQEKLAKEAATPTTIAEAAKAAPMGDINSYK